MDRGKDVLRGVGRTGAVFFNGACSAPPACLLAGWLACCRHHSSSSNSSHPAGSRHGWRSGSGGAAAAVLGACGGRAAGDRTLPAGGGAGGGAASPNCRHGVCFAGGGWRGDGAGAGAGPGNGCAGCGGTGRRRPVSGGMSAAAAALLAGCDHAAVGCSQAVNCCISLAVELLQHPACARVLAQHPSWYCCQFQWRGGRPTSPLDQPLALPLLTKSPPSDS